MKKKYSLVFWCVYIVIIVFGCALYAWLSQGHPRVAVWIAVCTVVAGGVIGSTEERSRGITKLFSSELSPLNVFRRLRDRRLQKEQERKDARDLESVQFAQMSVALDCLLRVVRPNSEAFWLAAEKLNKIELQELRDAGYDREVLRVAATRINVRRQDRCDTVFMPMLQNAKSQKEGEEIRQRLIAISRSWACSILEIVRAPKSKFS